MEIWLLCLLCVSLMLFHLFSRTSSSRLSCFITSTLFQFTSVSHETFAQIPHFICSSVFFHFSSQMLEFTFTCSQTLKQCECVPAGSARVCMGVTVGGGSAFELGGAPRLSEQSCSTSWCMKCTSLCYHHVTVEGVEQVFSFFLSKTKKPTPCWVSLQGVHSLSHLHLPLRPLGDTQPPTPPRLAFSLASFHHLHPPPPSLFFHFSPSEAPVNYPSDLLLWSLSPPQKTIFLLFITFSLCWSLHLLSSLSLLSCSASPLQLQPVISRLLSVDSSFYNLLGNTTFSISPLFCHFFFFF